MKQQSQQHQNQDSGNRMNNDNLSEKKKNIIHLYDVSLSETQLKKKQKTSPIPFLDEARPGKNRDALTKELFDKIVHYIKQNNFKKAEQFRERLIDEVPTAVRAIAKSGEIIKQKKIACMDPTKIKPWADLFNQFNNSEAVAFYFALKDFIVKPNQPVFQQGSCDNRLYFIRSGSLKLKYFDYDVRKNVSIATLRKGDIAGVETFFMLTNHTTNLIAVEESEISYLEKSAYQKILAENHEIKSKLFKYCETKQINYQQNKPENQSRRVHKRYKTELTGYVQRFGQDDKLIDAITKVKIIDISAGGIGYRVKNLKIGEASCLHNSRIYISAAYQKYSLSYELKKTAKVVSLKFLPFGECSVHIQFEEPMGEDRVMDIAQHTDVTAYI